MTNKSLLKAMEEESITKDFIKTEDLDLMSETDSQFESISGSSKKIKKRKKYSKIDDEIRMKLLEDVANKGDTLKAAAERYNVNYSSAKSIFHTYRKEGRILKKPAREKNRKKPLHISRSDINTNAAIDTKSLVVSDKNLTQNNNVSPLVNTNQPLPPLDQLQALTTLLKAAQETTILQQLQNIKHLLEQVNCAPGSEAGKENKPHIYIPKPVRPIQLQEQKSFGQKSSSTPTNKQGSLFTRPHQANEVASNF